MAIDYTSGTGLFDRLGKLGGLLAAVNTHRGTDLPAQVNEILVKYDGKANDLVATVEGVLAGLEQGKRSLDALARLTAKIAEADLIYTVDQENNLSEKTLRAALTELRRHMWIDGYYVDANTVSASVTQTNLDGDGVIVTSVKDPRGRTIETLLAEDIELEITGGSAGSETVSARGEAAVSDRLREDWPAGSGLSQSFSLQSAAGSGILTDGAFETWSGAPAALTNWPIVLGTYGTEIAQEAATKYAGTYGVKINGAATLTQIRQAITSQVAAGEQIAVNLWARRDGTPAAAGVLTIDLHDGTNVINDDEGTANTFNIDLTALTASFAAKNTVFRLPTPLPAAVYLRLRISTALTVGRSVYIDHLAARKMVSLMPSDAWSAPYAAGFSGAVNFSADDKTWREGGTSRVFKIASANNWASEWQKLFNRWFSHSKLGVLLPASGTTLINDALIS